MINNYTIILYCQGACGIIDTVLYIQICFEYIQITGHRDPYYTSFITSSLTVVNYFTQQL